MFEEDYKVDNDTEETPNKEKRKKYPQQSLRILNIKPPQNLKNETCKFVLVSPVSTL